MEFPPDITINEEEERLLLAWLENGEEVSMEWLLPKDLKKFTNDMDSEDLIIVGGVSDPRSIEKNAIKEALLRLRNGKELKDQKEMNLDKMGDLLIIREKKRFRFRNNFLSSIWIFSILVVIRIFLEEMMIPTHLRGIPTGAYFFLNFFNVLVVISFVYSLVYLLNFLLHGRRI